MLAVGQQPVRREPQGGQDHQADQQDSIVQRKDTQYAAAEESAVVAGRSSAVEQDPADEVAGQREEQLDAYPAEGGE